MPGLVTKFVRETARLLLEHLWRTRIGRLLVKCQSMDLLEPLSSDPDDALDLTY